MRVGIIGAGISGLIAAHYLVRKGHNVTVFEARSRIGGRIWTKRNAQGAALYERGAEWIDAHHEKTIGLAGDLGCHLEKGVTGVEVFQFGGRRIRSDDHAWQPVEQESEAFWRTSRQASLALDRRPWVGEGPVGHVESWIGNAALSSPADAYVRAVIRSDEGDEPDRLDLRDWLAGQRDYAEAGDYEMSAYRVREGMSALADRLADRGVGELRLGVPVTAVDPATGSVETVNGGTMTFDRIVITVPPPLISRILEGASSAWQLKMGRTVRVAMGFDHAWWRAEGKSGRFLSDELPQQLWDGTLGDVPVLVAYLCGEAAVKAEELTTRTTELLTRAFGILAPVPRFVDLTDWINDPWSGGGFSLFEPLSSNSHMRYLAAPIDRVHFAGEATALEHGFVEGAIESGLRVAREVIDA